MPELFNVVTVEEAREALARCMRLERRAEAVPLIEALGRRLASPVRALEDVPGFDRSTVDGYAVRAADTYGASEGLPAYLEVIGEFSVDCRPDISVGLGQAVRVATGGMLAPGTDAVVMVEYTEELDGRTISVVRPVAPGENVVRKGEDFKAGEEILPAGRILRPQDLGILAAAGITQVEVLSPLRVGIISTGDELVEPAEKPGPGQVRDINSYTLFGAVAALGAKPRLYGIVRDDCGELSAVLAQALAENDAVLLSGGSSVGTRDVTSRAIEGLGGPGVLFHGLAIKPGKPAVGAVVGGKPVFGLPGHPASALVVFEAVAAPVLRKALAGGAEEELPAYPLKAVCTRSLRSAAGREDFVRVRLFWRDGTLFAEPVLGKSGLISTLVKANGLARIPPEKEGVTAGEVIEVKFI